jgi:mRNA-degrading endonuclease YafQ of YafQ-DinJ toxin-antitoxin module
MNLVVRKHNANRYRSGLERVVAEFLKQNKKNFRYEDLKIEWKDLRYRTYTPDFILDNGIIVETKGLFDNEDRRKHLAVREQHPELDIRLVFSNAKAKLYKGSKTTYAMWCDKNGFLYSHRVIPPDWLKEKGKAVKTKRIKLKVGT